VKEFLAQKSLSTVTNRLQGRPASRISAVLLSAGVGVASAVLAYRFLRSGDDEAEGEAGEEPETT